MLVKERSAYISDEEMGPRNNKMAFEIITKTILNVTDILSI